VNIKVKGSSLDEKNTVKLQPKIKVQGKLVHYENSEQTLLESLESANIEVHYHCRDGFCGACRATLVEGEIHYPLGEPLAYVREGEILTCCCIPITDITLLIDE